MSTSDRKPDQTVSLHSHNNTHPRTGDGVLKIFTDGSSHGNPGPAGWAWFMDKNNYSCGFSPDATNQRMEMTAILEVLKSVPVDVPIEILTDSEFCVNAYTKWIVAWARNGWKKKDGSPISNSDLVVATARILAKRRKTTTVFTHVKAHCGIVNNEVVDKLANAAANAQKDLKSPGWTRIRKGSDYLPSSLSANDRSGTVQFTQRSKPKPEIEIVGDICPSCGRQVNPLTLRCGCFSD